MDSERIANLLSFKVDSGVWYYELEVVTEGIMQVSQCEYLILKENTIRNNSVRNILMKFLCYLTKNMLY